MTKTKLLRLYQLVSIVFGILLLIFSIQFVSNFTTTELNFSAIPGVFYGNIERGLFTVTLSVIGSEEVFVNVILFVSVIVLLLNVLFMVLIGNTDEVEDNVLQTGYQVNFMASFVMVLSVVLFVLLLPSNMNGEIVDRYLFVKMALMSDQSRYVVNLMYVVSLFYVLFNSYVFFKTMPESKTVVDEELYSEEFFTHLDEEEEDNLDDLDD